MSETEQREILTPREFKEKFLTQETKDKVDEHREDVRSVVEGSNDKLLITVGPCSIHDIDSTLEYAGRLSELRQEVKDEVEIVMRCHFEKPRTSIGWPGLLQDPDMDNTNDINKGLAITGELLSEINKLGLPITTELLSTLTPTYITDFLSMATIGARTAESQMHRQVASGLNIPVFFKNTTAGGIDEAVNGIKAARTDGGYLGINEEGRIAFKVTKGDPQAYLMLRGGKEGTNYHPETVQYATDKMRKIGAEPKIVIDCSHGNAINEKGKKDYKEQVTALRNVLGHLNKNEYSSVLGLSIESHLYEGKQDINSTKELAYGVSVTDGCLSFDKTKALLRELV